MTYPRILIIDDDSMICQLMETYLQLEQFQTSSTTSLDQNNIIEILEQETPDVLIMDFHLASHQTLDHLIAIRANTTWQSLPVMMTSAIDYSQKCFDAGASDFLVKPFDWQEVVSRIRSLLDNSVVQGA